MLELKQPLQKWKISITPSGTQNFQIVTVNEKGYVKDKICELGYFHSEDEMRANATLIEKAPLMAQALIDLHSQMKDDDRFVWDIFTNGIEETLKGLIK